MDDLIFSDYAGVKVPEPEGIGAGPLEGQNPRQRITLGRLAPFDPVWFALVLLGEILAIL